MLQEKTIYCISTFEHGQKQYKEKKVL